MTTEIGLTVSARTLQPGVVLLEANKGAVLVADVLSVHVANHSYERTYPAFRVWLQLRNNIQFELGEYQTSESAQAAADHFTT